jgi:ATP-binding cassette subfamily B protein
MNKWGYVDTFILYNTPVETLMINKDFIWKIIRQSLQLNRAVHLVWTSAPNWMIANGFLILIQGVLPLVSLYVIREIIDVVSLGITQANPAFYIRQLILWLILAASLALVTALVRSLGELASIAQAQNVTDHVSDLIHAQSIAIDLEYYENATYYDTLHRAQVEAPYRPTSMVNNLLQLFQNIISLVGVIGLFLFFNPYLGLVMILAAIPGALVRLYYSRRLFSYEEEQAHVERRAWYYHWLMIDGHPAKELRLYNLGSLFKNRYINIRQELRKGRLTIAKNRVSADFIIQSLASLAIFGTLGFAAYQALMGTISIGDLMAIYLGFQIGLSSLQAILRSMAGLYEDNLFLTHFYQFLEFPSAEPLPKATIPYAEKIRKGITFHDVSFSYPNSDEPVLKSINLTLHQGQMIALVGENGSGKTTLVKLLCQLYLPSSGNITVDGEQIEKYDLVSWRKKISVIFQDFMHYYLPIKENIWFGNIEQEQNHDEVRSAAEKSGADPFIQKLSMGYDTPLGVIFENGKELSGGEWQKIALARSFFREAEIVVLDEPTNSLDPLAEAEIFRNLRNLTKNKSVVLISHRFSTVQIADYIYVLDDGEIIEEGTHQSLINRQSHYAQFYHSQTQFYPPTNTDKSS